MDQDQKSFASWVKKQDVADLPELLKCARTELNSVLQCTGNAEPKRGHIDDPSIEWRSGKPNYSLANLAFVMGKSKCHAEGSLEMIVENAVKTWEMEASHKINTDQWQTIIHNKYSVQANGGKVFGLDEASKRGNYNVLLDEVDPSLYYAAKEDFDSSHHLFRDAFHHCFPWEVLDVFAGPPELVFSWRHWGEFVGDYKGNKGDGQLLEMTGFACVSVTEELKITQIKVFYDSEEFLLALKGISRKLELLPKPSSFSDWMQALNVNESDEIVEKAREEMLKMEEGEAAVRPDRGDFCDISWKTFVPDYTLVDLAYLKGRSCFHPKESLEFLVEKLVKSCEMEISHMKDCREWSTISSDREFGLNINGIDVSALIGSFSFSKIKNEVHNKAFPWEVTKVYSKAPEFGFEWRHWMDTDMKNDQSTIEEIRGFAVIKVDDNMKIIDLQVFYNPPRFASSQKLFYDGIRTCPFAQHLEKV